MPGYSQEEEEIPENRFEDASYHGPEHSGTVHDIPSYNTYNNMDLTEHQEYCNNNNSRNGSDSSSENSQLENTNASHYDKPPEFYQYSYAMSCHEDDHGGSGSERTFATSGTFDPSNNPTQTRPKVTKRKRIITFDQRKAANIRERRRMMSLNDSFDLLRRSLPTFSYEKKLSRIETLRLALTYIAFMADVLNGVNPKDVKLLPLKAPGLSRREEQEGPVYPYYM